MKQKARPKRVGELVRQEIAGLLTKGLKDPRVGFVSVMGVRMSADLRYANVYVSLYGDEKEQKSSLIGLQRSTGWIRREIGRRIRLRVTPEIRFFTDDSLDEVYHLEEVIHEIHEEQQKAPMIKLELPEIVDELRAAGSFLVTSHESPDGDAVGSVLAMYHLLRAMGKERIYCALADPVPSRYRHLPGASEILSVEGNAPDFEQAIILDVGELPRTGKTAEWISLDRKLLVLDHHLGDGPHGSHGFIDTSYAAVGEIMADLFEAAELPLSAEAAYCIYVAQTTDTGCYRYSNTNARSHRIAATLHETGIDTATICSAVFDVMPASKCALLRRVLDRMVLEANGKIAHSYVTAQDLAEVSAKKEDLDGLVNYLRNIEGVYVGALFNGVEPEVTKVSLRSREGFNSAEFLSHYGGGGHAAAAGATVEQPLAQLHPEMVGRIVEMLEDGGEES